MMLRRASLAVIAILLTACGGGPPATDAAAPAPPPVNPAPVSGPVSAPETAAAVETAVTGRVLVVDLSGNPLANIAPIATLEPNAFDAPVATGPLSGGDGRTQIQFPGQLRVFIRAWDPALNYFPNNFYEILPNQGGNAEDMRIEMAQSATVTVQLFLPDGRPAANENAGLMMLHPVKGPWWPASADTDPNGLAQFPHVPPGSFVLRLKVGSGAGIELPETPLRPGGATDLGPVTLQ